MKPACAPNRRIALGAAFVVVALFTGSAPAVAAGGLAKYEIVPGESVGVVGLGMTRDKVQNRLKHPIDRSHDGSLYSLTYHYPAHDQIGNPGGLLIVSFHGLARSARSVYIVTVEPSLGTKGEHIGVGDTAAELRASYPVHCYHSDPDGSRDPIVDDNENSECELRSNGGFTYFSFASLDADPGQRIGAIAVAARRVN